jgi:hypothetical protein
LISKSFFNIFRTIFISFSLYPLNLIYHHSQGGQIQLEKEKRRKTTIKKEEKKNSEKKKRRKEDVIKEDDHVLRGERKKGKNN